MSTGRHREREALGASLRLSVATALTTWAAMWSWRGFTDLSSRFLGALLVVALAVALVGGLARWRRLPGPVVVLLETVAGLAMVCLHVVGHPWPGPSFGDALGAAVDAANAYASPVPATDTIDVQPVLLLGGLIALLLVDLCAGTLRRVPLAGLPLLTVYSVPVSLLGTGLSWWIFAATAGGFLVMLFLQEEEHLSRWGRSLDGSGEPVRRLSDSVRASALFVGAATTAAAVLVPLAIPTFDFSVFDVGPGTGGDGDIDITNPMTDLRRDLVRGKDVDLVTVVTDDPAPDHLRISVLNRFTDNEWSAGDRQVPAENLAQGNLPPLAGVESSVATEVASYRYQVAVADELRSTWLPTQAPINRIVADGDWRYDLETMDFLAGDDDDLTTAGLRYDMTAVDLGYDQNRLLRLEANAGAVPDELTELPDDLDAVLVDDPGGRVSVAGLARRVVSGTTTDFEAAVVLNQWFRDDGGFTYELTPDVAPVGTDELAGFLSAGDGGRTGYCEQFSASMAVMARTLGIPARVAVGFLRPDGPDVTGQPDTWVYSAHDLHAWVELYFPGAGWVLFDPTPPDRVGGEQLPDYADAEIDTAPLPTAPQSSDEPRSTAAQPTEQPTSEPTRAPEDDTATDRAAVGAGFPWTPVLLAVGTLVLLLLLVRLPAAVRARQRARRLAGGPEAAWLELRASAVDLRLSWPDGRSPRETAEVVVGWFGAAGDDERPVRGRGVAPAAEAALDRIVEAVERTRYARRHPAEPGSLRDDVAQCGEALALGAVPRTRRGARWLPVSAFQRRPLPEESTIADEPALAGRVEHI